MADWEPADDPGQLTPPEYGVLNPGAMTQLEFRHLDRPIESSASSPTDRCEHLVATPAESGQQTFSAVILFAIGQHILGIGHRQRSLDYGAREGAGAGTRNLPVTPLMVRAASTYGALDATPGGYTKLT